LLAELTACDKRILTGSRDSTAKVWDAETGREMLTLKGHTGPVNGREMLVARR
jgi:WD40 repeat protein